MNILLIEQDFALDASITDRFVHAVQGPQKSRFSTSRRSNQCCDLIGGNIQIEPEHSLFGSIEDVEVRNLETQRAAFFGTRWCRLGHPDLRRNPLSGGILSLSC